FGFLVQLAGRKYRYSFSLWRIVTWVTIVDELAVCNSASLSWMGVKGSRARMAQSSAEKILLGTFVGCQLLV
ncbi:MAG: hypothetical protein MJK13_15030, partial [Pseudomonadales bacterium]|nr:hypothetical protein [Pseudomonadales bacterium]